MLENRTKIYFDCFHCYYNYQYYYCYCHYYHYYYYCYYYYCYDSNIFRGFFLASLISSTILMDTQLFFFFKLISIKKQKGFFSWLLVCLIKWYERGRKFKDYRQGKLFFWKYNIIFIFLSIITQFDWPETSFRTDTVIPMAKNFTFLNQPNNIWRRRCYRCLFYFILFFFLNCSQRKNLCCRYIFFFFFFKREVLKKNLLGKKWTFC